MLGPIEIHSFRQDTYEVSMIYDNVEITSNPEYITLYPTLYKEIKEHDAHSSSCWYVLSGQAYDEYMQFIENRRPIPLCGGWD